MASRSVTTLNWILGFVWHTHLMQYAIQAVASYDSDTLDGFDSSDFALKGEVQSSGGVTVAASSYGPFSSSILDNDGNVGSYASMVIGLDGLAVISYYDAGDEDLKVAHCSNTTCSSSSIFTVDSVGKIGKFTSISIGVDGLPLISYYAKQLET